MRELKLLLVEDDADEHARVRALLDALPGVRVRVDWVREYPAAVRRIAQGGFDLCLLDWRLDGRTGLDLLRDTPHRSQRPPVILLTGESDEDADEEAIRAGAADYLVKENLSVPALQRAVRYALERARVEDALRRSEELFRALIENSTDVVTVLDVEGRVQYQSPSVLRVLGHEPGALLGRDAASLVHPDDREEARRRARRLADHTGATDTLPLRILSADGGWRTLEVTAKNLLADAAVAGVVLNSRDVTERARAEAALRESEERLKVAQRMETVGRLAGGVAHDFNNLLTVITGHVELMSQDMPPGHPARPDLDEIRAAAERAAALTRQLLTFGRRQVLQPEVLDLNRIVAGMEGMLRRLVGEDVDLRAVLDRSISPVRADPAQLEQVVMNLVVNARDAMPGGGRLLVETRPVEFGAGTGGVAAGVDGGRAGVLLAVTDTGIGMDAATRERIFEPFFTTKEPGKGTGLGLATVYAVVQQAGGYVWVYSEPGMGTTFKVYLPAADEPAPEAARATPTGAPRGTETVLLVEDEPGVRRSLRKTLQRHGYTVVDADDGMVGLQRAEEHVGPLHLLLTDVVMPGRSGRDLARRVEQVRPGIRVLYMSGYTDEAVVHHGVLERGINFIQKPFSPDALLHKVREVLDT
jgi:two-component system cell cycle sensor histidine kinase/response regulator CckA